MHPLTNFLSYVQTGFEGEQHRHLDLYGVMAILCFEWITTVIKYRLITRNRLWSTGAVTQEYFQNSSLGKIFVSLELKKNKSTVRFFGVCVHSFCLQLSLEMLK